MDKKRSFVWLTGRHTHCHRPIWTPVIHPCHNQDVPKQNCVTAGYCWPALMARYALVEHVGASVRSPSCKRKCGCGPAFYCNDDILIHICNNVCSCPHNETQFFNPLIGSGNYSATSNNMKLVHWPLMGGLLHLVQR